MDGMGAVLQASGMKIGELATHSGLTVKTLRFYEDQGLLPAACRSAGGYRLFAEESLRRLEFIVRLKTLGLSLEEIRECLTVHDHGRLPCADIQRQLLDQISRIDTRLRELQALRDELQATLRDWQSEPRRRGEEICPNLKI